MLKLLRRQVQPDHERLSDEIIGYVLARQVPPSELVAAAQEAKKKAVAEARGLAHANDAAAAAPLAAPVALSPAEPPRVRQLHAPAARGPSDAAPTRASEWRGRELKRVAAVRGYVAEVGLTPATRQRLQDYAAELHGLAHLHGYELVGKIACLFGGLLETDTRPVFSTVETYLTCIRAVLRADVRDTEDPLGRALVEELFDLTSTDGPGEAAPQA